MIVNLIQEYAIGVSHRLTMHTGRIYSLFAHKHTSPMSTWLCRYLTTAGGGFLNMTFLRDNLLLLGVRVL